MKTAGYVLGLVLLTLSVLTAGLDAHAATPRDAGEQQMRQAQQMLQSLAREKAQLQSENQRLTDELNKAQAELKSTQGKLSDSEHAGDQMRERNAALVGRVRDDSERMGDLQENYRKQIGDARADIQLLRNAVMEREAWITDCQGKNEGLYKANGELLDAYRNKGVWDSLSQHDPVTGIGSVKVENRIQDYQYRLEDLRTVRPQADAAAQATGQPR